MFTPSSADKRGYPTLHAKGGPIPYTISPLLSPVRRTGVLEDIANAICFLCSEEASFITRRALAADGGLTLQLQEDLAVDVAHSLREQPDTWMPY